MLKFLSTLSGTQDQKDISPDTSESEAEVDIEFEDENEEEKAHYFLGDKIHENNIRILYVTDARDLVNYFKVWSLNRSLNTDHVDSIITQLKNQIDPYFIGSIKLVKDEEGKIRIIDGQHRLQALKNLTANKNFNMKVDCEVYKVKSIDGMEIVDLFKKANNTLNVKDDTDIPQLKYKYIIDALVKKISRLYQG